MSNKFHDKYRIEPNRWQYWDYSTPWSYFITICIYGMDEILGQIKNDRMQLSDYGQVVKTEIQNIINYNPRVNLDEWIIMPNHIHFILTIVTNAMVEKVHELSPEEFSLQPPKIHKQWNYFENPTPEEIKQYRIKRRKMLIPKVVGKFQMLTSKQINILRNSMGQKNWQSDYHDHVIRDQEEYKKIKYYILNNPKNWEDDNFFNPEI